MLFVDIQIKNFFKMSFLGILVLIERGGYHNLKELKTKISKISLKEKFSKKKKDPTSKSINFFAQ